MCITLSTCITLPSICFLFFYLILIVPVALDTTTCCPVIILAAQYIFCMPPHVFPSVRLSTSIDYKPFHSTLSLLSALKLGHSIGRGCNTQRVEADILTQPNPTPNQYVTASWFMGSQSITGLSNIVLMLNHLSLLPQILHNDRPCAV